MKAKWPIQIEIPSTIGRYQYRNYDAENTPCCAVGWCIYELQKINKYTRDYYHKEDKWRDSYVSMAKAMGYKPGCTVEGVNDYTDDGNERKTLYLLSWANLGYTYGMPRAVTKILKAIKDGRTFKSVKKAIAWAETKPSRRKKT